MNSFKKISLVTAAALTSTMFFATSSEAAPLAVTVASVANTTTSAAPATVAVPATNVIDAGHTVAIAATADTGTVVNFATTGVKLVSALNTVDAPKTILSGVSGLTATSAGTAITVYAYTTSTDVGSVTITNGAYSTIVYIKGLAGSASAVHVWGPTSVAVGTIPTVSVSVTDVFGNTVGSENVSVTLIGSTFTDGSITKTITTAAATNAATGAVLGIGTATLATAVAGEITAVATGANSAVAYTGLDVPVKSAITKFTVSDLNAEIASLKAQLAVAKADLATEKAGRAADALAAKTAADKALADALANAAAETAKVKADNDAAIKALKDAFNTLAKKWNAKNPKTKVALIK